MAELAYRLSLAPELEPFRAEIEYACDFLDSAFALRRAAEAERILHYGASPPPGAVAVPAALFPAGVLIDANGLHPRRDALVRIASLAEGGIRPPSGPAMRDGAFRYDAIGLIVFMLSRLEERGHQPRDRYARFPIEAALLQPQNNRLAPFADIAARDLAAALIGDPEPPPRGRYAVKLTHDVDILRGYHRPFEPLRNAAGDLLKRGSPRKAWRRLAHAYLRDEPWMSMRRLMSLSERHGVASHFYLMGPSDDPMDSPYVLRFPKLLRAVTDEITQRGHILGFHPGFYTFDDAAEWRRQRSGVENVVGRSLREGRHHVLRYDCEVTPRIWSDAGMTLDCTLAYPEAVGFRSGTCRPHAAYDLAARRPLPLKQLSTAVMEFGLFGEKYRDLPVEQAVEDSVWAADVCRKYGGTFVLLFHSGQDEPRLWQWYEAVVERVAR